VPTSTYVGLANITLGSSATSVSFSSISQAYRDLVLVISGRTTYTTNNDDSISLRFNSDTGSNYPGTYALGYSGGTYSPTSNTTRLQPFSISTSASSNTSPGNAVINIIDYSASDKHKSVVGRGNDTVGNNVVMTAARWANTNAITSIQVYSDRYLQGGSATSFAAGMTLALYGIAVAAASSIAFCAA